MRTLRISLLCLGAIVVLGLLFPVWWWIQVVPLACGAMLTRTGWEGFRMGLLGAGSAWLLMAGIQLGTSGETIAGRIAVMVQMGSPWTVLLATVAVAMLAGGISGAAGSLIKKPGAGGSP